MEILDELKSLAADMAQLLKQEVIKCSINVKSQY